jgi:hypothetical protein
MKYTIIQHDYNYSNKPPYTREFFCTGHYFVFAGNAVLAFCFFTPKAWKSIGIKTEWLNKNKTAWGLNLFWVQMSWMS